MISRLRWFCLLILSLFKKNKEYNPDVPVVTKFWVTPFDVELVSASSYTYSTFAGIAYWNFIFHGYSIRKLINERITPLGFQENMRFIRSMKLFQRVRLEMSPIYWNKKTITIKTKFIVDKKICAVGIDQVGLWGKSGRIKPQDAFPGLGEYYGDIPDIEKYMNKVSEISERL